MAVFPGADFHASRLRLRTRLRRHLRPFRRAMVRLDFSTLRYELLRKRLEHRLGDVFFRLHSHGKETPLEALEFDLRIGDLPADGRLCRAPHARGRREFHGIHAADVVDVPRSRDFSDASRACRLHVLPELSRREFHELHDADRTVVRGHRRTLFVLGTFEPVRGGWFHPDLRFGLRDLLAMDFSEASYVIHVATIPALTDNYCYLVWREGSPDAIVIDPSESKPNLSALKTRGLKAALVLNTHHHHDHVGGNLEVVAKEGCEVWCSAYDLSRVPGAKRGLTEGETFSVAGITFETWEIPGHTLGQVAFYEAESKSLFVGDTLFSMGCGRLFEGTPAQMHTSLARLARAPGDTRLHVGHEYTLRNAEFASSVEPGNFDIRRRVENAKRLGRVVPSPTVADELKVNPFLRLDSPEIRHVLGFPSETPDVDVFAKLREMRNSF